MANTVLCQIMPTKNSAGKNSVVTLDIYPISGAAAWQLSFTQTQHLRLQYGDKIKCVAGTAGVLINPGTQAGMFVLCPQLSAKSVWNVRVELEINDETTRHIQRHKPQFANDIGNTSRGTGATTR